MIFAILFAVVVVLVYLLNKHYLSFWERRGFKQLESSTFLVGNAGPVFTIKACMGDFFKGIYDKYKQHKVIGLYMSYDPVLVINDPKLVQDIMIRDFKSFHDRPTPVNEEHDPISGNLFNLPGQQWRDMRVKLSPTFTSGKLKTMFPIIRDCSKVLEDYLVKNVKNGVDVFEFRDLMARFNTNIISSVAFGIENDCINEPDHIFRKMGAKIFDPTLKNGIKGVLACFLPKIHKKLNLKMLDQDVDDFLFSMVRQTVEYREQKSFTRNDFMQLLIQLKDQGYVSVDKNEKDSEEKFSGDSGVVKKLTFNQIVAQAFVFFVAGFETSSSTLSFCLFELARNPEIQRKAQEEVDRVFKSAGAEGITYEMMNDLKYIESCVDETLRKYPIVPIHFRVASKDYKIADSNLTIPKGTSVFIPVLGHHRDPDIYENPMEFKPERFLDSSHGGGMAEGVFYTPFGDGPRNCIGMRLGKLTTKIALAVIMSKFTLSHTDTKLASNELDFHPTQFVLTPLHPFNLKISTR